MYVAHESIPGQCHQIVEFLLITPCSQSVLVRPTMNFSTRLLLDLWFQLLYIGPRSWAKWKWIYCKKAAQVSFSPCQYCMAIAIQGACVLVPSQK